VVHYLLVNGAEPDFVDEATGGSAFHAVCKTGHLDVYFLLLERKADPCKRTLTGTGALTLAARGGHASIVRVLLGIPGVDVNEKDAEGYSALWWAVFYRHPHVVKLLLDKGADWKITKEGGKSPLELARLKQNAGCLRLLVVRTATWRTSLVLFCPISEIYHI
jgi:palmitoyltransferase